MHVAPRARRDGVIAQQLDDDTVVYEIATGTAHRLDAATTKVWQMADGSHSVHEVAREAGLTPRAVRRALIKLHAAGLLVGAPRISRRWVLRRGTFAASAS